MPNGIRAGSSCGHLLRIVRVTRKRGVTRATVITLGSPLLAIVSLFGGSHLAFAKRIARSVWTVLGVGR
jgi:hypothetical protein